MTMFLGVLTDPAHAGVPGATTESITVTEDGSMLRQDSSKYNMSMGGDIPVNGMPNNSNKTLVDGQDATNPYRAQLG